MSKYLVKYREMPLKKRIQLILAILFTIAVLTAIPVYAWFSNQRKIAELQRIKSPDLLYISAACAEDVRNFDISMIDVGDQTDPDPDAPTSQLFPFAVAGEYVTSFTLQFAHTTNNPFVYKIYEGEILKNGDTVCKSKEAAQAVVTTKNATLPEGKKIDFDTDVIEYTVKTVWDKITDLNRGTVYKINDGDTIYILKSNCINNGNSYLNSKPDPTDSTRLIATEKYKTDCYGNYSEIDKYAEPLYWQSSAIDSVEQSSGWGSKPFFKTFILEVSWEGKTITNKETDMLYISAHK